MERITSIIERLNHRLLDAIPEQYPIGLAHGKMGLIIYLYRLYDYTQDERFKTQAEFLLDRLFESDLYKGGDLSVEEGLCGVVLGLDYLIRNRYVEGNINELAVEIDDLLFKHIVFGQLEKRHSLAEQIHWLYYILIRCKAQDEVSDRYLFEELAIVLINKIATQLNASFFTEPYGFTLYQYPLPLLLRVIGEWLKQGFYTDRLKHILDSLSSFLFAHKPQHSMNRLYLLWGLLPLRNLSDAWSRYVGALSESVDLRQILDEEFRGRDIYLSNGCSCLYLLLEAIGNDAPEMAFSYDFSKLSERIVCSDAWEELEHRLYYYKIHRGLLNGFPGVVLTLLDLKQNYL